MKIKLELVLNQDGQPAFLNYWNVINGPDVCCEIVDGKIVFIPDGVGVEISFADFVQKVKQSVDQASGYLERTKKGKFVASEAAADKTQARIDRLREVHKADFMVLKALENIPNPTDHMKGVMIELLAGMEGLEYILANEYSVSLPITHE